METMWPSFSSCLVYSPPLFEGQALLFLIEMVDVPMEYSRPDKALLVLVVAALEAPPP